MFIYHLILKTYNIFNPTGTKNLIIATLIYALTINEVFIFYLVYIIYIIQSYICVIHSTARAALPSLLIDGVE